MKVEIRKPNPAEISNIVDMMRRFAAFEGLLEYMTAEREHLHKVIFGDGAFVEALIALHGDVPVGYAIFYPHFSSFRGESGYYLEDIYVDESARGRGVGKALLESIARLARERGFRRIDFQVLDWNENAINFYKGLGAVCNEEESHFKFSDDAFDGLLRAETRV